jgi:hypothetical protein
MRHIEAQDPDRELTGIEHRIKGTDRIKEKVAEDVGLLGRTPNEALAGVKDAVRFTYQYSEERYSAGVRADLTRLKEQGFMQVEVRDSWASDQYKGVNTRWREPESGLLFEVQFHTRLSYETKQLTHAIYERLRNPATSDAERGALADLQRQACGMIPVPPGAGDIEGEHRD